MNLELENMSKDELLSLKKDVEKALKDYDERRMREAREAAERALSEYGLSLKDVTGSAGSIGANGKKTKNDPKYRNPEDTSKTWTGRGRKPHWVEAHLEKGGALEDLAI